MSGHRTEPYTLEELQAALDAYEKCGSHRKAAKHLGLSLRTFGRRLNRAIKRGLQTKVQAKSVGPQIEDAVDDDSRVLSGKGIRTLEDLLDTARVDLREWVVTKSVINKWEGMGKGGEPVPLWQVKAWLEKRPSFFVSPVRPVHPIKRAESQTSSPQRTALIVPDSQHGFRRLRNGRLEPLHDRKACDVIIQACQIVQPEVVVLLGDMLDLAPWSTKYTTDPAMRYTTQASLVELHWFIQNIRLACSSARIVYLEGNHEFRMMKALTEKVDEAVNLRAAGDPEDAPGVLSIERLLSLKDLDVEYLGPYGESFWLWDEIRVHHGNVVRQRGGATVTAMLNNTSHSQIVGHIHRLELAQRAIQTSGGRKVITAMSPGCLCRTDGAVPNAGGSMLDWQQGLGIVYKTESGVSMQTVAIVDGEAVLNGQVLRGEDRIEDLRKATSLPI